MDLIDRAALKADISLNYGSVMDAVIVNRIINQQKGINLQPVEQGKWIGEEVFADSMDPGSDFFAVLQECSVCHRIRPVDNYCSHCVARMNKEVE